MKDYSDVAEIVDDVESRITDAYDIGYEQGEKDAWEVARSIVNIKSYAERERIFGAQFVGEIIKKLPYKQIKDKLKYERDKKESCWKGIPTERLSNEQCKVALDEMRRMYMDATGEWY